MRTQESAGSARRLLPVGTDDSRFGNEHPPLSADPASFRNRLACAHRRREVEIERSRQQESVADQAVGRVESGIVHHLEIERAVRSTRSVEAFRRDREANFAFPRFRQDDSRLEQPVDRCRIVEGFERSQMRHLHRWRGLRPHPAPRRRSAPPPSRRGYGRRAISRRSRRGAPAG